MIWAWCLERIDPEKREEWIISMNEPVRVGAAPTPAQIEAEEASFMGAFGAGLPGMS